MTESNYYEMCEKASNLRNEKKFNEAINLLNQIIEYMEKNNFDLKDYNNLKVYAELANCLRTKYKKDYSDSAYKDKQKLKEIEHKKYLCSEKAIKFINGVIRKHSDYRSSS